MNLGMPEVILILVVALIIFGPRKLPELGKSLGQAIAQFRRASEDFKRSWEQEVELEKARQSYSASDQTSYGEILPEASSDTYSAPAETEPRVTSAEPEVVIASAAEEKPRSEHWI